MDVWRGAVRRFLLDAPAPHRHSEEDYELLSPSDRSPPPSTPTLPTHHRTHTRTRSITLPTRRTCSCFLRTCTCTLRRLLLSIFLFPFLTALGVLLWGGIPPSYEDIRGYERRLPQHNLSLAWPEGEGGMYLRFPGHLWGHGLNNILQETCVPFPSSLLYHSS
jgi:hypothetical protein